MRERRAVGPLRGLKIAGDEQPPVRLLSEGEDGAGRTRSRIEAGVAETVRGKTNQIRHGKPSRDGEGASNKEFSVGLQKQGVDGAAAQTVGSKPGIGISIGQESRHATTWNGPDVAEIASDIDPADVVDLKGARTSPSGKPLNPNSGSALPGTPGRDRRATSRYHW